MEYVVVTGASGGMGKATTELLVEKGFHVFALDIKSHPDFENNQNVTPIETDLTDGQSVLQAFSTVKKITENIRAIIHFAGIYCLDSLVEMSEEKFIRAFDINLFGAFRVNKTFLPLLKEDGRIIITTSELAPLEPLPFTGIYAITKSALDKYAYSLRMEVGLLGIKVSVIRSGAVKTPLLNDSTSQLDAFCEKTTLYDCNAPRFKKIVDSVEAKNVSPRKVAQIALKALFAKRPKQVYNVNRNPLLLTLNALPKTWQTSIVKSILKKPKEKKNTPKTSN